MLPAHPTPPTCTLLSDSPVRLKALRALFPETQAALPAPAASKHGSEHDSMHGDAILLVDASGPSDPPDWLAVAQTWKGLVLLLAPQRPAALPISVHWLATPVSFPTLRLRLAQAWNERTRTWRGCRLAPRPPCWVDAQGVAVALSDKEAQLLGLLMDAPAGLPRDYLLETLWGMDAERVETHVLETHLYRLRQKLAAHAPADWFLGLKEGICLLSAPE